ncbi:short-chain dehydrogenase [Bordetella hinzii]|uniref:SDR family oxidoreductase n=1 Tax=Bordetella hinzii TaxID=103855 RepID=UPI001150F8DA|nr:SDR family oxidoreductase [Bordetella hinzii]QDJ38770.1 short-chain dehydrogenase [Bordetella hinzii]
MNKLKLKPLSEQVIVITGAGSGIGAATAKAAARAGARVVLAGRDEAALGEVAKAIHAEGGEAISVVMDVGRQEDHSQLLQRAQESFGAVDTWVNNAGVSIFGDLLTVPLEDQRQLFETTYWGVVYGSLTAAAYLKERGGALVNVGSEVSDRAIPLQGAYSAAKHAVKGFTDALRMELRTQEAPVSVTLIKPASIDTGFTRHARNYMDVEPTLIPPVYAPELVADAILYAACTPARDVYVGSAAAMMGSLGQRVSGVMDRLAGWMTRRQRSDVPATHDGDALYEPGLRTSAPRPSNVRRHSVYTQLRTHGGGMLWVGAGALLLLGTAMTRRR